jgi:anti-sigma B factor antagonist
MAVSILHLNNKQCRIVVDGELTVSTVMELKSDLLFPLAKYNEIEIDLTSVSEIDSSGLQLLILAKTEAIMQGKSLSIPNRGAAVLALCGQYDLKGFFNDPVLIPLQE